MKTLLVEKIKWNEIKKLNAWVFIFQKYGKLEYILLESFSLGKKTLFLKIMECFKNSEKTWRFVLSQIFCFKGIKIKVFIIFTFCQIRPFLSEEKFQKKCWYKCRLFVLFQPFFALCNSLNITCTYIRINPFKWA